MYILYPNLILDNISHSYSFTITSGQWFSNCDGHIIVLHFKYFWVFFSLWMSWFHLKSEMFNIQTQTHHTSPQLHCVYGLFWMPAPFPQSSRHETLNSPSIFFFSLTLSHWLKLHCLKLDCLCACCFIIITVLILVKLFLAQLYK